MSVVEKASSAVNGHIHEQSQTAAFDGQKLLLKACKDGVCQQEHLDSQDKIRRYILEKQPHALTLLQRLQGLQQQRGTKTRRRHGTKKGKGKGKGTRKGKGKSVRK
jgi:hypothetical protein